MPKLAAEYRFNDEDSKIVKDVIMQAIRVAESAQRERVEKLEAALRDKDWQIRILCDNELSLKKELAGIRQG